MKMKNEKLTDEELMGITGGEAFLDPLQSPLGTTIIKPLYAAQPFPADEPLYKGRMHSLYAISPIFELD